MRSAGHGQVPVVVLTHEAPSDPVPGVTFAGSLESGLERANAAAGDRYVNVLGADVATAVPSRLAPVLLGDGTRLAWLSPSTRPGPTGQKAGSQKRTFGDRQN